MIIIVFIDFIANIFSNNYMPHGACYLWEPGILWSNVFGDGLTSLSYFMIPGLLIYFVKNRKDVEVNSLLLAFSFFIIACGLVHLLAIVNVWRPYYNISGFLKSLTAIISAGTVFMLYRSMPELIKIPSPASLEKANKEILELNENLEQKVEERTAELIEINKEQESFSYSISHDLQIPIRAILGFSSMIKEDHASQLDDEGLRKLDTISESANKMNELVQGILEFSRLGRAGVSMKPLDMNQLFRDSFNEVVDSKSIEEEIDFEVEDLPEALGDELMIKSVTNNIIDNSVKYRNIDSKLKIKVHAKEEGSHIVYSVSDNGIGFNMNYKPKMFEVFHQLHNEKTIKGSGVGLAIVHRIISKHSGIADAYSDGEGKGATIHFSLPKV